MNSQQLAAALTTMEQTAEAPGADFAQQENAIKRQREARIVLTRVVGECCQLLAVIHPLPPS